jgi:hypothetical protein
MERQVEEPDAFPERGAAGAWIEPVSFIEDIIAPGRRNSY